MEEFLDFWILISAFCLVLTLVLFFTISFAFAPRSYSIGEKQITSDGLTVIVEQHAHHFLFGDVLAKTYRLIVTEEVFNMYSVGDKVDFSPRDNCIIILKEVSL